MTWDAVAVENGEKGVEPANRLPAVEPHDSVLRQLADGWRARCLQAEGDLAREFAENAKLREQAEAARPKPAPYFAFLALPTGGNLDSMAIPGIVAPSRFPVHLVPTRGSAGVFNHIWCHALNIRKQIGLTHYAMSHSDVIAPRFWLDCLYDEMQRVGADVISACIAIKDDRGTTSTATRDNKTRNIRRFTMAELAKMPETFSIADVPWADKENDALLLNNGLWLCKFTEPWVEEVTFKFIEWNVKRPDGMFQANFFSEDWHFSEFCTERGLKLFATRKVPTYHVGRRDFPCDGTVWGAWQEEKGDEPMV